MFPLARPRPAVPPAVTLRRASTTSFVLDVFGFTWLLPQAVVSEAWECQAYLQYRCTVGVQLMPSARKNELAIRSFYFCASWSKLNYCMKKGQTLFPSITAFDALFLLAFLMLGNVSSALISHSLTVDSLDSVKFHAWLFIAIMAQEAHRKPNRLGRKSPHKIRPKE